MTEPVTSLTTALLKFHADPPHVGKDGTAQYGKYPTLAGVVEAIRKRAVECDLIWTQEPCAVDGGMPGLRTTLRHKSGESTTSVMPLAIAKPGPQEQGSALTYARRYALLSVFGLVGDEDDDGNAAQRSAASGTADAEPGNGSAPAAAEPQSVKADLVATDPQRKKIAGMAANPKIPIGDDSRTGLLQASEDPNLTRAKATELIDWLVEREKGAPVGS